MIISKHNVMRIWTLGFLLMILTYSCAENINSNELLKNESKLNLTIYQSDSLSINSSLDLKISSFRIKKLCDWLDTNKTDWKNSIASFAQPSISLIGEDFRMLIFKDFVVVGFTDSNGKQRQFTRQINFTEFNFLIEEKK